MFFETIWMWLNARLTNFIGLNLIRLEHAIEPAAVTCGTIFVMIWGYLAITGRIQEHLVDGAKRLVVLLIVFGVGLRLWLYNAVIVDSFFSAPAQIASSVIGSANPINVADSIWARGGAVAAELWNKGGVFRGDVGFYLAGAFVYLAVGAVAVYTMFLLCLSKVVLSIVLVLGPMFIVFLLFDATKRFFEAWMATLANYALVTILTTLASALLLGLVEDYAAQTATLGSGIVTVDALGLVLGSILVALILRQIPSIASTLASGVALSTYGVVGRLVDWGLGKAKRTGYEALRGGMDGLRGLPVGRYETLTRQAGNLATRGLVATASRFVPRRGGSAAARK